LISRQGEKHSYTVYDLRGKTSQTEIKEKNMGSKHKKTQAEQKANFDRKLEARLSFLSEKGIESSMIKKDPVVKKLQARVKEVKARLKTIASHEKRTEELAKMKAEKAAAPRKEKEGDKGKKTKETPKEGKGKKKKKE
jgi:hypothetical protein